jgi:anti-anti-sigma factor
MAGDSSRSWEKAAPAAVDVWREGGRVVIGLFGEHDLGTEAELSDALERFCGVGAVGDVIVDLSGASFIASTTIAALLGGRNLMRGQGRNLILRAPSPQAQRVLELCGVLVLFDPPAPGTDDAVPTGVAELPLLRDTRADAERPEPSPGTRRRRHR